MPATFSSVGYTLARRFANQMLGSYLECALWASCDDDGSYERNAETTDRRAADRRSQDLAAAGYDGRIVTAATGKVVQEWSVER